MPFTPRDVKDVSALVAKKLELYMNHERREDRFDPQGRYRTTPKMQTLDLMYHMLDTADLKKNESRSPRSDSPHKGQRSKKSKRRVKSPNKDDSSTDARNGLEEDHSRSRKQNKETKEKGKKPMIKPQLVHNSRRVVALREAERLTETANKILEKQDLDKLQVIHRYRPHSPDVAPITENGRVANYTLHVGSALHSKDYVDFYMKEGLQSSKKEYAKRLQRLEKRKERESRGDKKVCSETSSSARQNHKPTSMLRMQEIVNPRHSLDSLTSSRSSTPRKLNPLIIEQTQYNTFTNVSHSSRGSSEKPSKASSQLYKAKRYANGFGYRIIAENETNIESPRYENLGSESRADIASCEEYCNFPASPAEMHESGREGFDSEAGDKLVLEVTDVEMKYKKYKSSSISSVPLSKEKESEDTRAQTNNESYISASQRSARSTISQYSKSKDLDRSYQSNQSMTSGASGTYHTQESDLYNTTQSEHDLDSVRSTSMLSSTPRRPRMKRYKHEPIQTIINPPEVPRLGLPSDVNEMTGREMTGRASSLNSSAVEDYLTAEEKAQRHPDARALEGRINSSRARERTLDNDDSRAERSLQKYLCSDELPVKSAVEASLPPLNLPVSPKTDGSEREDIKVKKLTEMENTEHESICQQESSFIEKSDKHKKKREMRVHSVASQDRDAVIDCQDSGSQTEGPSIRKRANEIEGREGERGEDEMKNMEFHRGEVPVIDNTKLKVKPERGDDTPRTMSEKGRLTKSAKRRGVSNYYTMGEEERGLEKEYFEPLNVDEKEEYFPALEQEKESELNTPASSRPSSASSASSGGTFQSENGRKKEKSKLPVSEAIFPEQNKGEFPRPQSGASKSIDGRGDDSNSVKNRSQHKSNIEGKEAKGYKNNDHEENEKGSVSLGSQVSYGEDAQNDKLQISSGSRGSISTKERLGTGNGYSIKGEQLSRGQDENSERKNIQTTIVACQKIGKSHQSLSDIEKGSPRKVTTTDEQAVIQENTTEARLEHGSFELSRAENLMEEAVESSKALNLEQDSLEQSESDIRIKKALASSQVLKQEQEENIYDISARNLTDKIESEKRDLPITTSDVKHFSNEIIEKNASTGSMSKVNEQPVASAEDRTSPEQSENRPTVPSAIQELPLEENAFIEGDEVIKEAISASASASLIISDGDTVIDFRPLSASTAISVGNDYDDHKRMALPQPSKIVEVTETESNMGSGRDTQFVAKDPLVPHPAEKKQSKTKENTVHVVNIADVKLESYEHIKEHPAMKRSSSDYWSSKNKEKNGLQSDRNLSLPLDQGRDISIPVTPVSQNEVTDEIKKKNINSFGQSNVKCEEIKNNAIQIASYASNDDNLQVTNPEKVIPDPELSMEEKLSDLKEVAQKTPSEPTTVKETTLSEHNKVIEKTSMNEELTDITPYEQKLAETNYPEQEKAVDKTPSAHIKVAEKTPAEHKESRERTSPKFEKDIDETPSENRNGFTNIPEQERVTKKTPLGQEQVTEITPLQQEDTPSKQEKESNAILIEKENVVEHHSLQEVNVKEQHQLKKELVKAQSIIEKESGQSTNEQEASTNWPLSEKEKVTDQKEQTSTEHNNVIYQYSQDQETMKEYPSDEKEKVNEHSLSEKENVKVPPSSEQEQIYLEQEKVKEKSLTLAEQEKVWKQQSSELEKKKVVSSFKEEKVKEQPSLREEKVKEQPSLKEEIVKEQPSLKEEKVKKQPSLKEEIVKEESSLKEEIVKEQPSLKEEIVKEQPSLKEEIVKEQPSLKEEIVKEQPSLKEEIVKEESSLKEEKVKEQPSLKEEIVKEQPSLKKEKIKEQPSLKEEIVKEQPSLKEEIVKEQSSLKEDIMKEQSSLKEEIAKEQPSPEQEKVKEQPSPEGEKVKEQSSLKEEIVKEQSSLKEEIVKEQPSPEQEKVKQQPSPEQEKVNKQLSPEQEKVKEQPSHEQEKVKEQLSPEEEKVKEQSSLKEEIVKEQSSLKEEIVKEQPSPEQEKVKQQPSPEQEKVNKQPSPEQEKVKEQPSHEQEKANKQPSPEQEKVKEQTLVEQEKVNEQPSPEQEKVKEQPSPEQEKVKEQPSPEQEKVKEQPSPKQEKVKEQPSPEQEKVKEQPSPKQEKVKEQPSPEQEKVKEQPSHEQEKVKEQPSPEQEKVKEQPSPEQEKVKEQPSPEQEKVKELPSPEQEKVKEQPSPEQEKVKEQPSLEQEKVKEQPLPEQEKVKEQPSHEQEKVKEQPSSEQEKVKEQPSLKEEIVKEQLSHEEEKVKEQPSPEQEEVKEQPSHEEEKMKEQPSREEEKVKEQPSLEKKKVIEQSSPEQDKTQEQASTQGKLTKPPTELPLIEQEKVFEQPLTEQEKIMERSSSEKETAIEHPSTKQEHKKQLLMEQEEVKDVPVTKQEKCKEQLAIEKEIITEQLLTEQGKVTETCSSEQVQIRESTLTEKVKVIDQSSNQQVNVIEQSVAEGGL